MLIEQLNTIEVLNLVVSIIALIFIYKAYKKGMINHVSKKFWTYILLIGIFLFLAMAFNVAEDAAFAPYFNLLQHLSRLVTASIFVFLGKSTLKGGLSG